VRTGLLLTDRSDHPLWNGACRACFPAVKTIYGPLPWGGPSRGLEIIIGMVRTGSPSGARSESSGGAAKEPKRVQDSGWLALDRSTPSGAGIDFLGGRCT